MTHSARPFGLSTGGFDRRTRSDRRGEDRRNRDEDVSEERRQGNDRRAPRGRRITEWFPIKPQPTLHLVKSDDEVVVETQPSIEQYDADDEQFGFVPQMLADLADSDNKFVRDEDQSLEQNDAGPEQLELVPGMVADFAGSDIELVRDEERLVDQDEAGHEQLELVPGMVADFAGSSIELVRDEDQSVEQIDAGDEEFDLAPGIVADFEESYIEFVRNEDQSGEQIDAADEEFDLVPGIVAEFEEADIEFVRDEDQSVEQIGAEQEEAVWVMGLVTSEDDVVVEVVPTDGENDANRPAAEVVASADDEHYSFVHNGRRFDIEVEDFFDQRGRPAGRRWLVKADGVVEHTLRVLPNEGAEGVVQRAIQAIENTGLGASRELDFQFAGRRYHLEDWSNALTQGGDADTSMWCVTCDGVVEGSFASPTDETESILRYRAVEIARRSGEVRAIPDISLAARRSRPRLPQPSDSESKSLTWAVLAWIVVGVVAARAISGVVQTVLFGG